MRFDQLSKIPRSIVQLQKYFPKGKPKREGGTIFTNLLLLHDKKVDDMMLDMKDSMQKCNLKLGKQRVQYYNAVMLGHVWCLSTKS